MEKGGTDVPPFYACLSGVNINETCRQERTYQQWIRKINQAVSPAWGILPQVTVCFVRYLLPWPFVLKPLPDQEWFIYLFQRSGLFTNGSGDIIDTNGSSPELVDDRGEGFGYPFHPGHPDRHVTPEEHVP